MKEIAKNFRQGAKTISPQSMAVFRQSRATSGIERYELKRLLIAT